MRRIISTLLAAALLGLPFGTAEARPAPVDEGGDDRPCATYREFNKLRLDMRRKVVRKILDTRGHQVSKHAFDGVADMLGIGGNVASAPIKQRQIRKYPTCAEDGVPATLLVEYRLRGRVGRAVQILWL